MVDREPASPGGKPGSGARLDSTDGTVSQGGQVSRSGTTKSIPPMIWQLRKNLMRAGAACLLLAAASQLRAEYKVERVVAGLNQPISMTQAPGDSNSIYIVERADTGNTLGKIRNYNLQTGAFSTFLDLTGTINSDGGLLSMTFHPDYQANGLFYVVSNDNGRTRPDE